MNVANSLQTGAHVTNECAAMQSGLTSIQLHMTAKFRMTHHHKLYKQQIKRRTKIMKVNLFSPTLDKAGPSTENVRRSNLSVRITTVQSD
jgi:hypothetical protein